MSLIFQLLINGLIAGAIYAIIAVGFSLIYSTCKFMHFAHGATVTVSAYLLYFLFSRLGLDFGFAVILTLILASLLGYLMDRVVYKQLRVRKANNATFLMAGLALLVLVESVITMVFGANAKTIDLIKVAKGDDFLGAIITPLQAFIIAVSVFLFIALFFFMKKTKMGKAMRAVSDNWEAAEIVGISSERIYSWSFIIGSFIAGIAGILIGLEQTFSPTIGTDLILCGFTAAIIGGIDNVYAAVLGALLLGLVENFGILYLPASYKSAISFVLLFIFLLFRPQGILGVKRGT